MYTANYNLSIKLNLNNFLSLFKFQTLTIGGGVEIYEGWNFNSDNYLFTTDAKQIQVSKFYSPSM